MIAIIKYNAGNVVSVKNALGRLGQESIITDDLESIQKADKVIFPVSYTHLTLPTKRIV